jgi:hypothetical protein
MMLGPLARFLTKLREAQLDKAIDLLTEIERKWEFEWPHDDKHWRFYQKRKVSLELTIRRLRLILRKDTMEEA